MSQNAVCVPEWVWTILRDWSCHHKSERTWKHGCDKRTLICCENNLYHMPMLLYHINKENFISVFDNVVTICKKFATDMVHYTQDDFDESDVTYYTRFKSIREKLIETIIEQYVYYSMEDIYADTIDFENHFNIITSIIYNNNSDSYKSYFMDCVKKRLKN